jgi:NAD(P)-dependent dehydrogenase (short-subunit alcohol dehydrogenase family)
MRTSFSKNQTVTRLRRKPPTPVGGRHWYFNLTLFRNSISVKTDSLIKYHQYKDNRKERKEMDRLRGKVAVITGANAGIGEATAELFAREGAAVVLVARRKGKLKAVEERIKEEGGRALAVPGDVRSVEDCKKVFEQTIKTFGKVDILVNNAGIADRNMPAIRTTDQLWEDVIGTDLTGTFIFSREALKYMTEAKQGVIVNVSSIGGVYMNTGVAYSAAKAGVIGLTKNIALQYAGTDIRCNAVCPGPTPTELNTPEQLATFDAEFLEICNRHVDNSVGKSEPIDQANAILFLASNESRRITGQALVVDRGMCL